MGHRLKTLLLCFCVGMVLMHTASAKAQRQTVRQVAASSFSAASFNDFLDPGIGLGEDLSPLFQKKNPSNWTISNILLILPDSLYGKGGVFAFGQGIPAQNQGGGLLLSSAFINYGFYQPLVLLVFYQPQVVAAVPEASTFMMLVLGLPVLGWLTWRRRRGS